MALRPDTNPVLDLLVAYTGAPSTPPVGLQLSSQSLVLYGALDAVVILEVPTLKLVKCLAFRDAFPRGTPLVSCVAVEDSTKLIVAASGNSIALWSPSPKDETSWKLHSTLTMEHPVQAVDIRGEMLAVGTSQGLSVFTLANGDIISWKSAWSARCSTVTTLSISPSASHIATASKDERNARIFSTRSKREIQSLRHPSPISRLKWRNPPTKYKDEICLYTLTPDSVVRVFMTVIDAPNHLQLHASLDPWAFSSGVDSLAEVRKDSKSSPPPIFWLERSHFLCGVQQINGTSEADESRTRKLQELIDDDWELFGFISKDGSFVVRALTNLDKRPPTLLRQFTYFRLPAHSLHRTSHLVLIPPPANSPSTSKLPPSPYLITTAPLRTHKLSLLPLVDGAVEGVDRITRGPRSFEREDTSVEYFVRSPDGSAIVSKRREGGGEIFTRDRHGTFHNRQSWDIVPHNPLTTPTLLILPSTDTMQSTSSASAVRILSVTPSQISTFLLFGLDTMKPSIRLRSTSSLPLESTARIVLPVDPMAWSHDPLSSGSHAARHDALVSVSEDGTLSFWVPALENMGSNNGNSAAWICTGSIRTGRTGIRLARCSSAKKTALVSIENGVETLSIWDSKESEFASGLEYSHSFIPSSDTTSTKLGGDDTWKIRDLDWTSTGIKGGVSGGGQETSILAVGFPHRVVILCQQRMTYFDQEQAWRILGDIDLTRHGQMLQWTPNRIADSIWCAGGTLIVGAGHQVFHFGTASLYSGYQRIDAPAGVVKPTSRTAPLFERAARMNSPLPDYHPQMLLQCLLWDKVELVKRIIVQLRKSLHSESLTWEEDPFEWVPLDVEDYLGTTQTTNATNVKKQTYSYLFDAGNDENDDGTIFTRSLVTSLLDSLSKKPLPHLSASENAHLAVLIRTTLQIDEQRRSLDANGLRYLISIRSFYLINSGQSAPGKDAPSLSSAIAGAGRERLRYRDIVWAFFSESQEILLAASAEACGGKMSWKDARALGVFLWLQSNDSIKAQAEIIARNQYMAGEDRDPTACCLLYFALGKVKLVHGLWKQAAWHPEQQVMLKFLANDFEEHRWRTAALKNAFALMSKQRFEYAVAFFVLGRSLKDAVNVCIKQLKDFQLAIALARIMENGDDGPILREILTNTVLPTAFEKGNRWLASWAFWMLHRRDLSVRILITPLEEMARIASVRVSEIGNPHYDDPSLALLFMQLKDKSLQTVKGVTEITGRTEFNFVLQMARVFARMGCHPLALNVVAHWSFDRVVPVIRPGPINTSAPIIIESHRPRSPTLTRSSMGLHHNRAASLVIDMEIPSLPATRPTSPGFPVLDTIPEKTSRAASPIPPTNVVSPPPEESAEAGEQKGGFGSLMKSAKKDVKVAEFDMSAFF
ncbi:hypothetical protein DL93DRAFT_2050227 [Clavulina sp. PMI_390]|nr:hypothetical protein DL93DRAFT_2050227 [Clavulina sp. PMI_390]